MHALGHFKTITTHKLLVMEYCFKVGLYRQGLLHDLSKYSPTEFRVGMKYYTGKRSPNALEREELGYSTAWLHHKGRNKHHLEYWMDYGAGYQMAGQPMPTRYMVEMCLDRIAACRVYHGEAYTDRDPLEYLNRSLDAHLMHPQTRVQVTELLTMLAEQGEKKTLRYIRNVVLKNPVELYPNLPPRADPAMKDATFLSGEDAGKLARSIPTPFYLYSQRRILRTARKLGEAFSWCPGWRQFFPVKACPNPAILKLLREAGQGAVCSSAAELELLRKCGFGPEEVLFMPNYPKDEDLRAAADYGCGVLMDGPGLVEPYRRMGLLRETVGLRLNPGGVFRFGKSESHLAGNKSGFLPEDLEACVRELLGVGVRSIGLHAYLSGNTLDPAYWPAVTKLLCCKARELTEKTGARIAYLDISGGLGIPYRPEDTGLDLGKIAQEVRKTVLEADMADVPIYTELGRWITGPAGLLITRVTHVRKADRNYAGVDASAADLMRPMLYGAYHHISVAGKSGGEREPWDVVGTVAENTDKFCQNRQLPSLERGDVLLIHDAGAHGHAMGYQYGGRLRPAEYLLKTDGHIERIRRAETAEDYLATAEF